MQRAKPQTASTTCHTCCLTHTCRCGLLFAPPPKRQRRLGGGHSRRKGHFGKFADTEGPAHDKIKKGEGNPKKREMAETDVTMPDTNPKSFPESLLRPLQTTTTHSFQILSKTPLLFLSITALSILPCALLLFSLAFSSRPLERQISYKIRLSDALSIPVEVQHVYNEARSDAFYLLRLKALYFLPFFLFSLLAALTAVSSAALAHHGKRPSHSAVLAAARKAWPRFASTSAFAFVAASGCGYFARGLWGLRWLQSWRPAVAGAGMVLEVYVKEVLSLGMVASVVEERWVVEALVSGWEVMEGRRACGTLLGGLLVLESCGIGWGLRALMDGGTRMQLMEAVVGMVCLVGLFCWVVLWSFVSNTVFYLECKKFRASEMDSRCLELVNDAL